MSIGIFETPEEQQKFVQGLGNIERNLLGQSARQQAMLGDPSLLNALMEQTMPKTKELTAAQKDYDFFKNLSPDQKVQFLQLRQNQAPVHHYLFQWTRLKGVLIGSKLLIFTKKEKYYSHSNFFQKRD